MSQDDEYLAGAAAMMCAAWIRLRAEAASKEARFYAGRVRQAYWRGVRPGPGWRMSMQKRED